MKETSARTIADFFIFFSHEHGDLISNLKLQKLLYYAQAWFLAIYGKPLFEDRIEAWVHGPVVPPVYGEFKKWSWKPIDLDVQMPDLPPAVRAHLEEIMDVYGGMSAFELEKLTHSEQPWVDARGPIPEDEACSEIISHDSMKAFYGARLRKHGED